MSPAVTHPICSCAVFNMSTPKPDELEHSECSLGFTELYQNAKTWVTFYTVKKTSQNKAILLRVYYTMITLRIRFTMHPFLSTEAKGDSLRVISPRYKILMPKFVTVNHESYFLIIKI